jgi:hypothetical protein
MPPARGIDAVDQLFGNWVGCDSGKKRTGPQNTIVSPNTLARRSDRVT